MTKFLTLLAVFLCETSFAGGNSDYTKIKNITYKADGGIVMEFEELVQEKHFMPLFPKGITKLRFEYRKWPKDSRYNSWWDKILRFSKQDDASKQVEFEACINWMIANYKTDTSFQFGQIGGGKFEIADDAKDEVIIPFVHFEKTRDGKEQVCLIDLG